MATAAQRRATSLRNLAKAREARRGAADRVYDDARERGESVPQARARARATLNRAPATIDARDPQFRLAAPRPKAVVAATVIATYALVLHAYGYDGTYPGDGGDGDTPDTGDGEDGDGDGGDPTEPPDDDEDAPDDGEGGEDGPCIAQRSALQEQLNTATVITDNREIAATNAGCDELYTWEVNNNNFISGAWAALSNAPAALLCETVERVTEELAVWTNTGSWPGNGPKPACEGSGDDGEGDGEEGDGDGDGDEGDDDGVESCFGSDSISNAQYEGVLNYIVGLMSTRSEVPAMTAAGFSVAQWASVDPTAVGYYYMDGAMLRLAQLRGDTAARDRIVNAIVTGGETPCVFGQNLQGLRIEIGNDFDTLYPDPGAFTWPA